MKILFYGDEFVKMRETLLSSMSGHDAETSDSRTVNEKISGAEVLVTRPGTEVSRDLLEAAPNLKLHQLYGTGLEGADFEACADLGIAVCNVPSLGTGNAEGVAEIALLHMLLLGKKYSFARENARAGRLFSPRGISLWKKRACIVGLGNLGHATAERLSAIGMVIRGVNRSPVSAEKLASMGVREFFQMNRLYDAVSGCRFVIAALALNDETCGIFDEPFFRAMDAGSFFINVARGGLVREDALLRTLNEKHLAGAGLDVLADEPTSPDNPLLTHPSVTLTPHIGGNTDESVRGILGFVRDNIDRLCRGEDTLSRQDLRGGA
ncbi:MAG: 2-hydroxyacid dehydrogenase [Synergistaceae bacterium]|jgi:phosphoglycerate dehydrogenase-like enzyme|nr:2-hydroxyacid dehydrogenase [Synergistaceae bacterium]